MSHCCAQGPEQGAENKTVKKVDRIPVFWKLTGQWTMGVNHEVTGRGPGPRAENWLGVETQCQGPVYRVETMPWDAAALVGLGLEQVGRTLENFLTGRSEGP